MTLPPDYRSQLQAWGDEIVAAADRSDDAYVVNTAVKDRLAALPPNSAEREAIYDLLIDWLRSADLHRWHPALLVLLDEQVQRAAPAVRGALDPAAPDDKRSHARMFEQVAHELEHPPALDIDPAVKARWEAFEAAVLEAGRAMPVDPGSETRRGAVEVFVDDGDYTNALLFAAGGVKRSDGRSEALVVANLLRPQLELWLRDAADDELSDRDRAALEQALRRLRTVQADHADGTAIPPEFRATFEAAWDRRGATPGLDPVQVAQELLSELTASALERRWITDILIGWLHSDDRARWEPAVAVLEAHGVRAAAPDVRFAASFAATDEKRAAAAAFLAAATSLEAQ